MLVHAVRALATARGVDLVVVAAPADSVSEVQALLSEHGADEPSVGRAAAVVVAGGATRQASVAAALGSLPEDVDVVLVHDAARPLVPVELVDAIAAAVRAGSPAVVPGLPVNDTIKRVGLDQEVEETLDRSVLRAIQTPQGFRREVLAAAHAAATDEATDDAGLVEAIGVAVLVIPGAAEAFKVTRPLDLVLAEAVLARRRAAGVVLL
jgi:2-C-methyl-D-erythritol 4-phosphate cytidylyltransferase